MSSGVVARYPLLNLNFIFAVVWGLCLVFFGGSCLCGSVLGLCVAPVEGFTQASTL